MMVSRTFSMSFSKPARCRAGSLLSLFLIVASTAVAQSAGDQAPSNETIKQLVDRLTTAEAKIQQLEAQMAKQAGIQPAAAVVAAPSPPATPAPPPEPAAAPEPAPAPVPEDQSMDHMMAIPGGPVLHFRGFFDVDFDKGIAAQNLQYPSGTTPNGTFRAGEFDLFMTSQLSEKLSFLAEMVTSSDQTNSFGIDLERFQLTTGPRSILKSAPAAFTPPSATTTPPFTMALGFPLLPVGHSCIILRTAEAPCRCMNWASPLLD